MVKESSGPVPLGDILREMQGEFPQIDEEKVAKARKLASHHLLRGAAEHHLEVLADPDATSEAREDSRRGVLGDEADFLAANPDGHAQDELDP